MLSSVFKKQNVPVLLGLAVGGAVALHLSRGESTLRADAPGALDPKKFVPLPLASSKYISKDTKELVFDLPDGHTLGGKTAYMVLFKRPVEGASPIVRPYTPVSSPETEGKAVFVIKAYPNGAMTQWLHGLKPGDNVEIKGPMQKALWEANKYKKVALLGGGSGITPLFQVLETVANNPADKTEVELYVGNKSPEDTLLKSEIDALVAKKPKQLKATFFVDKEAPNWDGEVGYLSEDYLKKNMFKSSDKDVKVFVCGPPGMYKALSGMKDSPSDQGELSGALKDLGFTKEQVFKF